MSRPRLLSYRLLCLAMLLAGSGGLARADAGTALHDRYEALSESLGHNAFGRPLVLESVETADAVRGDIYAVMDHGFDAVSIGLLDADHWCDVMLLHINTKYCHAVVEPLGTRLWVNIGKKTPEALADVPRVVFSYRVATADPDYLDIEIHAPNGPYSTRDYRIRLEALALPNAHTFMHLTYSYSAGLLARVALQTYLFTAGSDKVGFTVAGKRPDGQPQWVGGVRGLLERNTMRIYLAIDAFLAARSAAAAVTPQARFEQSLQHWFSATEQYPRQLHEVDRLDYLVMKRAEHARQQTLQ